MGLLPVEWKAVDFDACILNKAVRIGSIQTGDYRPTGRFPVVDQSQRYIAGYSDREILVYQDQLPVILFGDHTRIFKFIDFPFICGADGTKVLHPNRLLVDPQFFYYALLNLNIPSRGYNRHYRLLKEQKLPIPPLSEQRSIAQVLNCTQREIAAQEQVIGAAREVKRALMARLFRYGPGAEPARTKETQFGQVPENWQIVPLRDCAVVQTGTTKGRKFGASRTITVPYLRVANVQDGYLDLTEIKHIRIRESELERYLLHIGDVVLTEGGDFDKLGRGFIWQGEIPNCIHQNHVFAVRTKRETLQPDYLAYLTQSDYGKTYFLTVAHKTTNLASINSTKLKAFPVLIPSLPEQQEIADILTAADRKIAAEEGRKAALEEVFRSLLGELMTGRIRVRGEAS